MRAWFQALDQHHDGTLDLPSLTRVFRSLQIPLSRFEIYSFFKGLLDKEGRLPLTASSRIFAASVFRQTYDEPIK